MSGQGQAQQLQGGFGANGGMMGGQQQYGGYGPQQQFNNAQMQMYRGGYGQQGNYAGNQDGMWANAANGWQNQQVNPYQDGMWAKPVNGWQNQQVNPYQGLMQWLQSRQQPMQQPMQQAQRFGGEGMNYAGGGAQETLGPRAPVDPIVRSQEFGGGGN
jgi:hypothetical protein